MRTNPIILGFNAIKALITQGFRQPELTGFAVEFCRSWTDHYIEMSCFVEDLISGLISTEDSLLLFPSIDDHIVCSSWPKDHVISCVFDGSLIMGSYDLSKIVMGLSNGEMVECRLSDNDHVNMVEYDSELIDQRLFTEDKIKIGGYTDGTCDR